MRGRILVVDDHCEVIYAVRRLLEDRGIRVVSAEGAEQAEALVPDVDALILDIELEDDNGLVLLERLREAGYEPPTVVLSAHTFPDNIVEASKGGALQVLPKPIEGESLLQAAEEALQRAASPPGGQAVKAEAHDVLGTSPAMMEVFKALGVAASNGLNLLLTGETGVGKEVAAELVHRHSSRAQGPFVAVNCTAVPEGLLEAELFGHASGAFTGASRAAEGKVEAAAGGTLFLDEIGDMPLSFQAKLLRFLEDKRFFRLGESVPRQADVRVITATNQRLTGGGASGFRQDLYHRMAQISVHIPPLRERWQDIPGLIETFLASANRDMGLAIQGATLEVLEQARLHRWPGNVRELKNAVYRAAAKRQRGLIDSLDIEAQEEAASWQGAGEAGYAAVDTIIEEALRKGRAQSLLTEWESRLVARALAYYGGNKSRVAEALGVSRNTLRAKIQALEGPVA